jgi:hypothetical protein
MPSASCPWTSIPPTEVGCVVECLASDMSSVAPLVAAVIGAGGVVFGGVLTTSGQLIVERGRARRERDAGRQKELLELRLAARLVVEELAECAALIEKAAETGRYWRAPRQLPAGSWDEYRTDIAVALDSAAEWRKVTTAYDATTNLNWTVEHRRNTDQTLDSASQGPFVKPEEQMRAVWRSIQEAIGALEHTIHTDSEGARFDPDFREHEGALWPFGDGEDFDVEEASLAAQQELYEQQIRDAEM